MQNAETVLAVIHKRGKEGKPLERVYRNLFNRDLFLMAYGRIYRNKGAMTPGVTSETVDGMSLEKIDTIIEALRHERYGWKPARRTYIPKRNGKKRPLGLPPWSDKLVQEVIRLLLEAFYEPQFSDLSHGFRPKRGCHTALGEIYFRWRGTSWFIEGDISKCFDRLDHRVLLETLSERIHDGRFTALIEGLLKAGYMEEWKFHRTLSGAPQGGVVSPILSNIYLNRFDRWIEKTLIPKYWRGDQRGRNPEYYRLHRQAWRLKQRGQYKEAKQLRQRASQLPSSQPNDPDFRRLRYIRYCDDFLLGYAGTRREAEEIKDQIEVFLRDELALELSRTKTLITHARTEQAHFLGYDISTHHNDTWKSNGYRFNGVVVLNVPLEVIKHRRTQYCKRGKPISQSQLLYNSVYEIITQYQLEYRGIVEYYRMAHNLYQFDRLKYVMEVSLAKTLAHKLRISVRQVYRRFQTTTQTANGPYKVLQYTVKREGKKPLKAMWGGISLKRNMRVVLNDCPPRLYLHSRTELEQRLLANTCELCGSTDNIQVHHIRALRDLNKAGRKPKPVWVQVMAARRRKTLVVCHDCHQDIHNGRLK